MSTAPLRVGFPAIGGDQWKGGQNYLRNLLQALTTHAHDSIAPVLFCYADYAPELIEQAQVWGVEVVIDECFAPRQTWRRLVKATITGRDNRAAEIYARHRLDLVFENAHYHGWRFGLPTLAWFPDFQHQHMPHLFSRMAWWRRELGFRLSMLRNEHVLLSSVDARNDLDHFYPGHRCSVHVVPFAINPPKPAMASKIKELATNLKIEQGWFFLPNHFWVHKNHEVVLRALAEIKADYPDITVVSTGNTLDPRDLNHFSRIENLLRDSDLEDNFRILGLVPYEQLTSLMQGAIALINPSKFEGWSTIVEEAKVYGTPLILSDIGVHREQCASTANYFPVDDPTVLSRILKSKWENRKSPNEYTNSAPDETEAQERFRLFATKFAAACQEAAS